MTTEPMRAPGALATVVVTERGDRLRAPWRLLLGLLVMGIVTIVLLLPIGYLFPERVVDPEPGLALVAGSSFLFVLSLLLSLLVIGRWLDRRPLSGYGLSVDRGWIADAAAGLLIGAVLPTGIFLVGWIVGWVDISSIGPLDGGMLIGLAPVVLLFVAVGITEELLLRGWLLTNVAEAFAWLGREEGVVVAIVLTSGLFGLLHLANPGASIGAAFVITLAGVFLALGYVYTGALGLPIGIHVTWNLFLGGIYGFPVSGLRFEASPLVVEVDGPSFVTGGAFGPEAGLLGAVAVLFGIWMVYWWVRWSHGDARIHRQLGQPPR